MSESNGRGERGRFIRGNTLARGNPNARRMHELRGALLTSADPEDVKAVLQRHLEAGCTRVLVAPFPRTRAVIERTLHALAPAPPDEVPPP